MRKFRTALHRASQLDHAVLTLDQLKCWRENGFLILKELVPQELAAAVNAEVAGNPQQLHDLHLGSAVVNRAILSRQLVAILSSLLDGHPIIIRSLALTSASQQPSVPDKLLVSSLCLEDVRPGAGPLFFYPGSHTIPPFKFSSSDPRTVEAEMNACRAYLENEVATRSLWKTAFMGVAGDTLLLHPQLLHGGLPVRNPALTCKSMLTQYGRRQDQERPPQV